jgi:hypothetical protein
MNRYIVPKIFCAVGTFVILAGVFLSELNITLGNFLKSGIIAVVITAILLLCAILAFNMKTSHKKKCLKRTIPCRFVEFVSVILFVVVGLASLIVVNHCITVWLRTSEIQKHMNIRQLENMLPEYEKYASERIKNYTNQLNEAILYRDARPSNELTNLGFNINSNEALERQRDRKIEKLKQILRPHTYKELTDTITASIAKFIGIVEDFSPITAPKNITRIERWTEYYENQLNNFSQYKMKGENAKDFHFQSTFGNVEDILTQNLTEWDDPDIFKRFLGYGVGLTALLLMLFPYFFGNRSIKLKH